VRGSIPVSICSYREGGGFTSSSTMGSRSPPRSTADRAAELQHPVRRPKFDLAAGAQDFQFVK
jgi:hypothetical protein